MSDAIYNTLSKAFSQVNDTLRDVFARDGMVCYLLQRRQHSGRLEKVREVTRGWFLEYGNRDLREDVFLDCADVDEDFSDDWAKATHVAIGVPDCDNQIFVYEMTPEQKDGTQPDGASPTYKAFLTRVENERFKVF